MKPEDSLEAPRPGVQFAASPINEGVRATLKADVMVSITYLPTSVTLMLSAEDARQLAFVILRETEKLQPRKDSDT